MIVGWPDEKDDILQKYTTFENKYAGRKDCNGEIKSTTLKQKQFKYGFASLNKQNAQFVNDFLSLFDKDIHIYFSICSKIEYLILQLFQGYRNNSVFDADFMKYSIIKTLVMYRPKEIIKCIYESPMDFLEKLKNFFRDRIECNKSNPKLKQRETKMFQQILLILDEISDNVEIDWDYHMPFDGFKKYLTEKNIVRYNLIIDKEGKEDEESKTLRAAREIGLNDSDEGNSTKYLGIRIADMIAGIMSKLLKALNDSLRYHSFEESINKKLLDIGWFCLNETQLNLYKKLYTIICEWNPAWYKSYSGLYSDDLILLNTLLNFMNQFESIEEIRDNINMQGEYFNTCACEELERYFKRRGCKLPIEPVMPIDKESYLNQRGGRAYFDSEKHLLLPMHEKFQTFEVLSVGMDHKFTPIVTILKDGEPKCYRLPNELSEWVCWAVGIASMGLNPFPAKVTFSNIDGKCDVVQIDNN